MAKKKVDAETATGDCKPGGGSTDEQVSRILEALEKKFGARLHKFGYELAEEKRTIIPVSPMVDIGIGGGIPEGSWVSLSGVEKLGKTSLALSFAAEAQKPEYGNRPIFLLAPEHRLKPRDVSGIKGLDRSKHRFQSFESVKGCILDAKGWLTMAGDILTNVENAVVIIDSISALCSPQVLNGGIGTADYGSGNRLVSQFIDIYAPTVAINKSIVIGIVHFYVNAGKVGPGPAKTEKAASRWKYQADVALSGKYWKPWHLNDNDPTSPQLGQTIEWHVKTTATNTPPGARVTNYLRYGTGLDKVYESMLVARDIGLIEQAGAWYKLTFLEGYPNLLAGTEWEGKEVKVQGAQKAYNLLTRNEGWMRALSEATRGVVDGEK